MRYQKSESEMDFSLPLESTFDIEKSSLYQSLCKGNGIKACDFIYLQSPKKVLLIEAKKSSPDPQNPASTHKVAEYSKSIHLKVVHSLLLLLGMAGLRSYPYTTDPPKWIEETKDPSTKFIPILVIKNIQKEWLQPISDKLRQELSGTRKAFRLEDLIVMNEEMARAKGFIQQ